MADLPAPRDDASVRGPWPPERPSASAWLRDHLRVARDSLGFISARLATSLLVWLLIGIALALPAGLYLLQNNLAALEGEWQGRPGLSVYFADDASDAAIRAAVALAEAGVHTHQVWHITPEQALDEFQGFSGLTDAVDLLPENPLPHSLRVTLLGTASVADLNALAGELSAAQSVADVVLEQTWLARLAALTSVVNRLGAALGIMFAVGAVLVTATSVRLAIEARLAELQVQTLVGAEPGFIRRPFLYLGALYGLGGALLALMLLSGVLLVLERPLAALIGSYGGALKIAGFDPSFIAGTLALGALLGLAGALAATRERLASLDID